MYSMAAFGPVLGFLLGAYLLSFHMDAFSGAVINIGEILSSIALRQFH
jgi:solute carrier organic anion transporter family, member 3A